MRPADDSENNPLLASLNLREISSAKDETLFDKRHEMPGILSVFMMVTATVRPAASFGRTFRLGLLPGREER